MFRDEAATIYSAHLNWSQLIRRSGHGDFVLLPYYALIHFWLCFYGNVAWVCLVLAAAFGLTVYLTGLNASRLGERTVRGCCRHPVRQQPLGLSLPIYLRPHALSALAATLASLPIIDWIRGGDDRLF